MRTVLAALLILSAAGCSSIDISEKGGRTMVSIHNSGWEAFSCIPLASGNPDQTDRFGCLLFENSVTLDNNLKMLERTMKEKGANGVKSLSSSIVDETVFFILINRRVYHTSAELVYGSEIPERAL